MKKFFEKIIVFGLPLVFLLVLYESFLRISLSDNIYSYKNKILKQDYEAIILGNSHALRGIVAKDLNFETKSMANVSQSINIDVLWLQKAIKENNLKFIILNISLPTFTSDLFKSTESWRVKNYNIYTDIQLDYSLKSNFESLNGYQINKLKDALRAVIKKSKPEYLVNGSAPLNIIGKNFQFDAREASTRHLTGIDGIEKNLKILDEIVKLSESKAFDIILVTLPVHKFYRDLVSLTMHNHLYPKLTKITNNYSNVYWFNCFEDSTYQNHHFKDSNHLNNTGAVIFTEKINQFLNNIYR